MKRNQVTFIIGETGSGKTTQVPQYLFQLNKYVFGKKEKESSAGKARPGLLAITQPRRVAAITLAQRVSQEMACKLGGLVGYRVRFEEAVSEHTRLKFMTDGMLLREAILDRNLSRYSIIILDEAHERTVSSDVLLALVKDLC